MSVCVSRKPNYYFWNSFLLLFIITLMCFCCFSIRCDISSNRTIVSVTVLLTLITFKWTLNKNIPSISYLTTLDHYSLMNIFIVFGNCVYYAIMGVITSPMCPDPYRRIDFIAFLASVSLFILLNLLNILRFIYYLYKNRKLLNLRNIEYSKNNSAKRARIKSIFQSQ